jgi:alkylhydroperoxidase/carboxymuconolactone decarboxylase family protein YurZ
VNDEMKMSWREYVGSRNPELQQSMVDYIDNVMTSELFADDMRELLIFAASTAIRYQSSMKTHAIRAMDAGASLDQVFQAGVLASLSAGFTCLIDVSAVLQEIQAELE